MTNESLFEELVEVYCDLQKDLLLNCKSKLHVLNKYITSDSDEARDSLTELAIDENNDTKAKQATSLLDRLITKVRSQISSKPIGSAVLRQIKIETPPAVSLQKRSHPAHADVKKTKIEIQIQNFNF
jgi:hypothetical protein